VSVALADVFLGKGVSVMMAIVIVIVHQHKGVTIPL